MTLKELENIISKKADYDCSVKLKCVEEYFKHVEVEKPVNDKNDLKLLIIFIFFNIVFLVVGIYTVSINENIILKYIVVGILAIISIYFSYTSYKKLFLK